MDEKRLTGLKIYWEARDCRWLLGVTKLAFFQGVTLVGCSAYLAQSNVHMFSYKTNWTSITRHLYVHAPIHAFLLSVCQSVFCLSVYFSICLKEDIRWKGDREGKDLRRAGDGEWGVDLIGTKHIHGNKQTTKKLKREVQLCQEILQSSFSNEFPCVLLSPWGLAEKFHPFKRPSGQQNSFWRICPELSLKRVHYEKRRALEPCLSTTCLFPQTGLEAESCRKTFGLGLTTPAYNSGTAAPLQCALL